MDPTSQRDRARLKALTFKTSSSFRCKAVTVAQGSRYEGMQKAFEDLREHFVRSMEPMFQSGLRGTVRSKNVVERVGRVWQEADVEEGGMKLVPRQRSGGEGARPWKVKGPPGAF